MKYLTTTYGTSSSAANAPNRSRRRSGASQRAVRAAGLKSRTSKFPLVHRVIFGLSSKPLAAELDENPHAVYLTDAQNRTALDWATARSQLEDMALVIKYGADPNNMM